MQRSEALRVAFIDFVEDFKRWESDTEHYSKLVKFDINGKDKEIYSVKLPGNLEFGEGKPENQNHAILFTRKEMALVLNYQLGNEELLLRMRIMILQHLQ
ncbi:hypothetical protein VNO77_44613 [Canavalia gladiata]|uniref:Glycosyl transferase 48 domain-containing protein n=1 Tax=Canavalia gladiata TaxID=3824 RepID=A0AAN9JYS8_CANGL